MSRIVIGVGNRDRGDDAAGVAVAEGVAGVETHVVDAGALNLYEHWTAHDTVIVVDAMRSGAEPGTILSIDATNASLPDETFASTHSFGPAVGIELARALGKMPASIEVIGIEAGDFTTGSEMSPAVQDAVLQVAKELTHA